MTQLGKYELLEKIGEGGFGIVYKARDPLLERNVAIKILRADIAGAPDFIERFRREARLAASLRHPNIVSVIEVGEQEGRYYLVMEYLEGQVLSERLKDGKPLPLNQVVEILRPLAEALDYAHGRGLVHRDVKPSNMILCDGGKRPVLTDFGLVKSMSESGLTTTGVSLGTVEYMAPEQILGQEPGPAADQYALGVVAYQMLTGQVPFGGTTPFAIQKGHTEKPTPDPRMINPTLPKQVTVILGKAMAKKSEERFKTSGAFITALHAIVSGVTQTQVNQTLKMVQRLMDAYQFDQALELLDDVNFVQTDERISTLRNECSRRKEVFQKAQELLQKLDQATAEMDNLRAQEKWLPGEKSQMKNAKHKSIKSAPPPRKSSKTGMKEIKQTEKKKRPLALKIILAPFLFLWWLIKLPYRAIRAFYRWAGHIQPRWLGIVAAILFTLITLSSFLVIAVLIINSFYYW